MTQADFVNEAVAEWSRLLPDEDMRGLEVFQRLVWSGRIANRIMERTAVAGGFSKRGDYEVLSLLRRSEPALLTPVEVAHQLLSSQSGMTGKLDRLEQQGLIQRSPDRDDRRAIRLHVTDAGRTLVDEAFTTSRRIYDLMLDELSRIEIENLTALLGKVLNRLDRLSKSKPWESPV